jgi:hypothetical protein
VKVRHDVYSEDLLASNCTSAYYDSRSLKLKSPERCAGERGFYWARQWSKGDEGALLHAEHAVADRFPAPRRLARLATGRNAIQTPAAEYIS